MKGKLAKNYFRRNPTPARHADHTVGSSGGRSEKPKKTPRFIGYTAPYRGGAPAFTDLLSGEVQVMFVSPVGLIEYIQAARVRALAVTTATRVPLLPDLPPLSDFVPGYESSAWYGMVAPKGTPTEITAKLNNEIAAGLADPQMKARLIDLGGTVLSGTPEGFGKFMADEAEKWGKVIRAANIKAE